MERLKSIFDELFKFKENESVKHKGDNKSGISSDMGLLILHRQLTEEVLDNEGVRYEKNYLCRVIRFSGSGDIMRFKESELMSMDDYSKQQIEDEVKRNEFREEGRRLQAEVFKAYGVTKSSVLKLKAEPSKEYTVTGFKSNQDTKKFELSVTEIGGIETGRDRQYISDPKEIESIS